MDYWVTGGAGFLGSHVVDALAGRDRRVLVIDDFTTHCPEYRVPVECFQASVQDPLVTERLAADRPAVIFHFAGDALVARSVEDPTADCGRNLLPTLALLEAVRKHSPETRVLFASTGAVYGETADKPFREDDPVFPISPYAVAKLAAERYCFAFAHTYGLRTCSLRLFSVYGPRQRKQVIYDLIRKVQANPRELTLFGDGTQARDFSHARNIADAFLLAAEKAPFRGEVINVASGEVATVNQLAAIVSEAMQASPEIRYTGQCRPGDSQRWTADTTLLQSYGYRPAVALEAGIRDTVAWVLSH